jgi:DNA-3-methyladenine glycosylase II
MAISSARMKRVVAEICEVDKKFISVVESHPLCTIGRTDSNVTHFESLVESVVSQQLAVRAAETIHGRLVDLTKGKISPKSISKLNESQLRSAGLSGAKTKTIQGMSSAALTGEVPFDELHLLDDQVVFEKLTSLWGIGPWTVDMFMMFQLGRLDIWPTGDLGVRRGWERIHKLKEEIEPKKLELRGEKFRGHRSVVAWYCWRALENK